MNNPFKNNALASGLLGFILGIVTLLGGQSLLSPKQQDVVQRDGFYSGFGGSSSKEPSSGYKSPSYHGLANNPDGDVVITKSGDCYHSPYGCATLRRSKNIRTVDRDDAEAVGLTPCTKCNP